MCRGHAGSGPEDGGIRVSVVITTRNEEKNIGRCIESVLAQTFGGVEIIVVDNGSRDATKSIASRYTEHVFEKGPERSAQRNYGMIERSTAPYVMYLDADMILGPCCVACCVETIRVTKAAALHVPEIVLGTNFFSRVRRFERGFYDGTVIDGARFFDRAAFVRAGGFDESMSGPEDWDMDKKIKQIGPIVLTDATRGVGSTREWVLGEYIGQRGVDWLAAPAAVFHNESEFCLRDYLRKKTYYMGSFGPYVAKWGVGDADVRRQLGAWHRFAGVFWEGGKWRRLVRHPLLTCGMYFMRAMVGLRFLWRRISGVRFLRAAGR